MLVAPHSTSVSVLLPLMNEYGVGSHADGLSEEGVHHVQLSYAPYAALLAAFEETSLRGVEKVAIHAPVLPIRGRFVVRAAGSRRPERSPSMPEI
jgi:hypothetical protein